MAQPLSEEEKQQQVRARALRICQRPRVIISNPLLQRKFLLDEADIARLSRP